VPRELSGRVAIPLAGVALAAFALRFWLHDAFPYLSDFSEESYRRYWPLRWGLVPHIAGGTIALFAGPFQLWSGFRRRFRAAHRWTGYAYISGVVLSAVSSFSLVFHTLPDFGLSLFVLAIMWLVSVGMALAAVRNGRYDAHREWMSRSYIVTFAFVSYRFLVDLPVFSGLGGGRFASVLWISWVVPMMLFEVSRQWTQGRRKHAAVPVATDAH
jgi:uncharacterized membrane protein